MLAATAVQLCARQGPPALRAHRAAETAAALLHRRARTAATQMGHLAPQPEYCILEYDYTHHDAELLAKREAYLQEHLRQCKEMADQGKLLLWGAVGSPITGGMLIWRNADEADVKSFVKRDPLVTNGLVRHWTIKPFHVHVVDAK